MSLRFILITSRFDCVHLVHSEMNAGNVNPSIIPTYFFCPLTRSIMRDPVITPYGNTYERLAILRHLVLEPTDPKAMRALHHEELADDYLVRQSIDKARKEAWIRYVVEFRDEQGGGRQPHDLHEINYNPVEGDEYAPAGEDDGLEGLDGSSSSSDENEQVAPPVPERVPTPQSPGGGLLPQGGTIEGNKEHRHNPGGGTGVNTKQHSGSVVEEAAPNMPNHGWSVPLGVHRVTCAPPGLVVTSDVHRRSTVVKRKIIKKSLVNSSGKSNSSHHADENDGNLSDGSSKKRRSSKIKKQAGASIKKMKIKRRYKKGKKYKNLKTTTSVITRDLVLPPGSFVEVLETRVHGGRVRGRIAWEEEVVTEMDRELELLLEEEEVRKRAMARPGSSPKSKSKGVGRGFFRRKLSQGSTSAGGSGNADVQHNAKLPFTSELFSDRPPHRSPAPNSSGALGNSSDNQHAPHRSPSPLSPSIKYTGWISLQWAGFVNNYERDLAIKHRRSVLQYINSHIKPKAALASDEDEGPWTSPLPLGVYRVSDGRVGGEAGGSPPKKNSASNRNYKRQGSFVKQLPLYDAPDEDSNIVDFLVSNQTLEIVETQVLVMKGRRGDISEGDRAADPGSPSSANSSSVSSIIAGAGGDAGRVGKRVVRARCMVPVIVPKPLSAEEFVAGRSGELPDKLLRKFRTGWITLEDGDGARNSVVANPIPLGAYVVTSDDPLLSCDGNAKIKSIYPAGSCMEVDATRIDFEEGTKTMKCRCGREGTHYTVAIRALISSGGYVTLFVASVGTSSSLGSGGGHVSSLCACGKLVPYVVYAEPVPLGMYRITQPTFVTQEIGHKSPVIAQLKVNTSVRVMETRVEEGCVRGRVNIIVDGQDDGSQDHRRVKETMAGWVSLFEPPSFRWAELSSTTHVGS